MQLLANIFVFLTFFMIPFLGGNHLPFYYISIDRFWIEGVFGIFLVIAITLSFLKDKTLPTGFFRYCFFFLPLFILTVVSLSYSWNVFNTLLWISVLVWAIGCAYLYAISPNKDICLMGLITGAVFTSISAILQLKILFPNLLSTFQQGINAQSCGNNRESHLLLTCTTTSWVDTWLLFFPWLFTLVSIKKACFPLLQHLSLLRV